MAAARGETWPQLQFSFWTGLRPSELIALEWGDIDWIAGEIRIVRAKTRAAKEPESTKTLAGRRTVKLLAPAREALLKQKELTFLAGGRVRESNVGRQASRPQRLDHDRQGVWSLDALR